VESASPVTQSSDIRTCQSTSTPSRWFPRWFWSALGGVRTTMAHRLRPGRCMSVPAGVMSAIRARTALTLGGRRALGRLRLTATTMVALMSRAARPVALRGRSRCHLCVATVASAAPTEKREWPAIPANSLRLLALICTKSTRFFHLAAALLSNTFISSESSTPHA
jgi:hypothetical protein